MALSGRSARDPIHRAEVVTEQLVQATVSPMDHLKWSLQLFVIPYW